LWEPLADFPSGPSGSVPPVSLSWLKSHQSCIVYVGPPVTVLTAGYLRWTDVGVVTDNVNGYHQLRDTVPFEKLVIAYLFKKYLAFYGIRRLIPPLLRPAQRPFPESAEFHTPYPCKVYLSRGYPYLRLGPSCDRFSLEFLF
jgi:hypothetical protein